MSQMLYLNSVDSTYDDVEKYYRFTLPRPITTDNKRMSLRLVECEVPITYFNIITGYNDFLEIKIISDTTPTLTKLYQLTIPQKNYSVQEMLTTLNALIVSAGATFADLTTSISFNSQTLRFSVNVVSSSTNEVLFISLQNETTAQKVTGAVPSFSSVSGTSASLEFTNSINMNRTKNIYIMTNDLGIDTRTNTNNNKLSILSKVQASQPFGSIVSYQSESDNYITINPQITYIDHVDLYLLDDEGVDLYLNGVNWCVSLVFQEVGISNSSSVFEATRTLTQLSM